MYIGLKNATLLLYNYYMVADFNTVEDNKPVYNAQGLYCSQTEWPQIFPGHDKTQQPRWHSKDNNADAPNIDNVDT